MATDTPDPKSATLATVAVSDCLRGSAVRWDGDDNADCWPRETVARLFDLVGLCPEGGIGMGVARAPIQLVGNAAHPRAVAIADQTLDYTDRLAGYAREQAPTLRAVSGYIFADRSPSCGLRGVKVFGNDGDFRRVGRGVYAAAVCARCPDLPVVDAQMLNCKAVLVDFATAVVAFATAQPRSECVDRIRATIEGRIAL